MSKKKAKAKRQELQLKTESTPEKNSAEFTFGGIDDDYSRGTHVSVSYTGAGISHISFMSDGLFVSQYSALGDKDIADLLDVMRQIVAIADALEVLA